MTVRAESSLQQDRRCRRLLLASISVLLAVPLLLFLSRYTSLGPVPWVNEYRYPGFDFNVFYRNARNVLTGTPFESTFHKPWVLAYMFLPFTYLPLPSALFLFRSITVAVAIAVSMYACRCAKQSYPLCAAVAVAVISGYPAIFLLERGNIDGLSLGAGIVSLLLYGEGFTLMPIAVFALFAAANPNTLALLPGFVACRQGRARIVDPIIIMATILVLFLAAPGRSSEWISVIGDRAEWDPLVRQGSVFRIFMGLSNANTLGWCSLILFAGSICFGLLRHARAGRTVPAFAAVALLLPLCEAYPKTVFLYGFLYFPLLLPFYCAPRQACGERFAARAAAGLGILGVLLSQFPAAWMVKTGSLSEQVGFWVPSCGLFLMLAANSYIALAVESVTDSGDS